MADEVKVVQPRIGVQSTIVVSNTDLVTTMVVKLMKKLKSDLALKQTQREELEKTLLVEPTEKAISIAKAIIETDSNLLAWKSLLKSMNPKTDFEINFNESQIENYVRRCIEFSKKNEGEINFEINTLNFDFDVKNERRTAPYFYDVKIGDLPSTEFPVQIDFKMNVDKTELNKVKMEIKELERQINNKQAIQDQATAAITEATIANNPDLQFLVGIGIDEQNLLSY
jgi:Pyruvate/2-oxoacid:ferredoxin oxidoreductase gamma subunit